MQIAELYRNILIYQHIFSSNFFARPRIFAKKGFSKSDNEAKKKRERNFILSSDFMQTRFHPPVEISDIFDLYNFSLEPF